MLCLIFISALIFLTGASSKCVELKVKHECYNISLDNWIDIKNPKKVFKLDIHDSDFPNIEQGDGASPRPLFNIYENLAVINLTRCNIKDIDKPVFEDLENLTTLIINYNSITSIPVLHENLVHLDLSHNQLGPNIENLDNLENLMELHLHHNNIEELVEENFPSLSKLKVLDLSFNKLQDLPSIFSNVSSVTKLNLVYNSISKIEDGALSSFSSLKSLLLANNKLITITKETFGNLTNLKHLYLHNNNIETIDEDAFATNPVLERITLSNNNIVILPPKIFFNKFALKHLVLQGNLIQKLDINIFKTNHALSYLDLSANSLELIEDNTFYDLDNLEYLLISDNKITQAKKIFLGLAKIKYIDASSNHITNDIDCTSCLKLNTLKLSDNKLSNFKIILNDGFVNIDLADNMIGDINNAEIKFKNRGYLSLDFRGNPIKEFDVPEYVRSNYHVQHLHLDGKLFSATFLEKIKSYKSMFYISKFDDEVNTTNTPLTEVVEADTTPEPINPTIEITTQNIQTTTEIHEEGPKLLFSMLDLIWYCLGTFLLTALLVGGSITFYCCLDRKKLKSRLNHKNDNGLDEIDYHRVLTSKYKYLPYMLNIIYNV